MTAVSNPAAYRLTGPELPSDPGEFYAWQDRAACRSGKVAELFFAADYEPAAAKAERQDRAVMVCSACPVRQACLEHAMTFPEPAGVWGGLTEDQRNGDRRKARRAQDKSRAAARRAQQDSGVAA